MMKRELGIARCGLACCLCSENTTCNGCDSGNCPDNDWCENRKCSLEKGIAHCYAREEDCKKGILGKIKPYGFTLFIKRYGEDKLLDCLAERMRKEGLYIIVRESMGIMITLMMWRRLGSIKFSDLWR